MAGRRRGRPRRSLATTKKEKVPVGGRGLPALVPRAPAFISVVDFTAIPPGSSLQSCLKLLPKSTWIQRQRRCLLLWHSCSSPHGLSWGRPKASSPQVSGPNDCPPAPGSRRGGGAPRQERGPGFGDAFATRGGDTGSDVPRVRARWDAGAPGWASLGAGNFCPSDPLFLSEACSGRRLAELCGSETWLFFGNWWPRCPAQAARRWGREKEKVVTTPGKAALLLGVQACFSLPRECSKKFPREAIVRNVETPRN